MSKMPESYSGTENYIFVSYSHRDTDRVVRILERMNADGFRIWFDDGIQGGADWDEYIASHAKGCKAFIGFMSDNYVSSTNCRDELNFVRDLNKDRLLVYLDDIELPDGMKMRLSRQQALFWNRYENDFETGIAKLESSQGVIECRRPLVEEQQDDHSAGKNTDSETTVSVSRKPSVTLVIVLLVLALLTGVFGGCLLNKSPDSKTETGSKAVAANRNLIVTLSPSEEISLGGMAKAQEIIAQRFDFLKQFTDGKCEMTIDNNNIILKFPGDLLGTAEADEFVPYYLSRAIDLCVTEKTSGEADCRKLFDLDRKDIVRIEMLDTAPQEMLAQGFSSENEYVLIELNPAKASQVAGTTHKENLYLFQDYDLSNPCYAPVMISADGAQIYVSLNINDPHLNKAAINNWKLEALETSFYYSIEDNVNMWANWEDPAEIEHSGVNQVAYGDLDETFPAYAFSLSRDLSAGEWLDSYLRWKNRLDLLDQPYAFGIYDSNNVVFKTSYEHLNDGILSLLSYSDLQFFINNYRANIYYFKDSELCENDDGSLNVTLKVSPYHQEECQAITTRLLKEEGELFYELVDGTGQTLLAGRSAKPVSDEFVFNQVSESGDKKIGADERWLAELICNICSEKNSYYSYMPVNKVTASERAKFGFRPDRPENSLAQLESEFPDLDFAYDDDYGLIIYANLPVDDEIVTNIVSLFHKLSDSRTLMDLKTSYSLHLIKCQGDEDVGISVYEPKGHIYNAEYEIRNFGGFLHFRGGRVIPFKDEMKAAIANDPLFASIHLIVDEH